jgi:hypothetical protein
MTNSNFLRAILRTRRIILQLCFILAGYASAGAESSGDTLVITSKPKFEQRGESIYLVLADRKQSCDILWGLASRKIPFRPVTLDTKRTYTFVVAQKPFRSLSIPELRTVLLDGQTIYDIESCEVHKTKMDHKEVRIFYGLIPRGAEQPSMDTERRLFPHRYE